MPAHQGGAQTIRDSNARDAEAVCAANPPDDPLISAGAARALWRWRHVGIIPPPVVIQGRNYWRKRAFLAAIAAADQSRGA
jgi:hypothetical protein